MSETDAVNMSERVIAKFDLVAEEIARQLNSHGRDANVILQADRGRLKIRMQIYGAPSPEWLAYELEPQQLLGPVEPWQLATWIIAGWIEASQPIREQRSNRGFVRE